MTVYLVLCLRPDLLFTTGLNPVIFSHFLCLIHTHELGCPVSDLTSFHILGQDNKRPSVYLLMFLWHCFSSGTSTSSQSQDTRASWGRMVSLTFKRPMIFTMNVSFSPLVLRIVLGWGGKEVRPAGECARTLTPRAFL